MGAPTSYKWSYTVTPLSGSYNLTTGRSPLSTALLFAGNIMTPDSEQYHTVAAWLFDSTKIRRAMVGCPRKLGSVVSKCVKTYL